MCSYVNHIFAYSARSDYFACAVTHIIAPCHGKATTYYKSSISYKQSSLQGGVGRACTRQARRYTWPGGYFWGDHRPSTVRGGDQGSGPVTNATTSRPKPSGCPIASVPNPPVHPFWRQDKPDRPQQSIFFACILTLGKVDVLSYDNVKKDQTTNMAEADSLENAFDYRKLN